MPKIRIHNGQNAKTETQYQSTYFMSIDLLSKSMSTQRQIQDIAKKRVWEKIKPDRALVLLPSEIITSETPSASLTKHWRSGRAKEHSYSETHMRT